MPVAPGRLSTTTCWPSASPSFCERRRATRSVPPPGGNPTIMRIVLLGYCCAPAADERTAAHSSAAQRIAVIWFFSSLFVTSAKTLLPHQGEGRDGGGLVHVQKPIP